MNHLRKTSSRSETFRTVLAWTSISLAVSAVQCGGGIIGSDDHKSHLGVNEVNYCGGKNYPNCN